MVRILNCAGKRYQRRQRHEPCHHGLQYFLFHHYRRQRQYLVLQQFASAEPIAVTISKPVAIAVTESVTVSEPIADSDTAAAHAEPGAVAITVSEPVAVAQPDA